MELRRLYMRNFLAVGDEPVEILFSATGGITLIRGNNQDVSGKSSNGSGKSTIIEGIFFGLTGATLRKLNGPSIIHNAAANECRVEIEYDDVKIVRILKRQAKTVKSSLEYYVANQPLHVPSVPETNKMIDAKRGINFETLSNILIFGQHNIISFLDAGEPEKRDVVENLVNLKEYNQYEQNARDQAKEAKNRLKSLAEKHGIHSVHLAEQAAIINKQRLVLLEYRKFLAIDIGIIDANIATMPDIERLKEMWRQHGEYIEAKKKLADRLAELTIDRNQHQSEYNAAVAAKQKAADGKHPLIDKLNQVKAKSHILEERKRQLWQENVHPIESQIAVEEAACAVVVANSDKAIAAVKPTEDWGFQIAALQRLISQQRSRISDIESKALKSDETCPTCYGVVNAENAEKIINAISIEITSLVAKMDAAVAKKKDDEHRMDCEKKQYAFDCDYAVGCHCTKIDELTKQLNEAKEKVKTQYLGAKERLDAMIAEAEARVANFDEDLNNRHDPLITTKQAHISNAEVAAAKSQKALNNLTPVDKPSIAVEEIGKLQSQLKNDKKLKAEKEALLDKNPYVEMIATLQDSITKIEMDVTALDTEIKEVEAKLPYYEFWVSHMGKEGIKSFVIDQIIPTLNQQIEYWMQLIYQGTITVKFDKYFNVSMVNNASKNEMIFGQGSGGERRRIDIAIMLAFRQVMKMSTGKDPSILLFDEAIENLDYEGINSFHNVLLDIAKTTRVYIITHNRDMLSLLENCDTILVEKVDGAMKIK